MGRLPILDAKLAKSIIKSVGEGLPYALAAQAAGISDSVIYKWLRAGRAGDTKYVQFFHDVEQARAKGAAARIRRINKAAKKNWNADAWVLARTLPDHFAESQRELKELRKIAKQQAEQIAILLGKHDTRTLDSVPKAGKTDS